MEGEREVVGRRRWERKGRSGDFVRRELTASIYSDSLSSIVGEVARGEI